MNKTIEVKIRRTNDGRSWEDRPIECTIDTKGLNPDQIVNACVLFAKSLKGVEIRYNYMGSLQGHYHFI